MRIWSHIVNCDPTDSEQQQVYFVAFDFFVHFCKLQSILRSILYEGKALL